MIDLAEHRSQAVTPHRNSQILVTIIIVVIVVIVVVVVIIINIIIAPQLSF